MRLKNIREVEASKGFACRLCLIKIPPDFSQQRQTRQDTNLFLGLLVKAVLLRSDQVEECFCPIEKIV
jgi:hypothetical protein